MATTPYDPSGIIGTDWGLIFDDEFSGSSLDTTKWQAGWFASNPASSITPGVNPTLQVACFAPANVAVGSGYLQLKMVDGGSCSAYTDQNGKTYRYAGAMVTTDPGFSNDLFSYEYGFAETRIFLPGSPGSIINWPGFWQLGIPDNWPNNGEIDTMEGLSGTAQGHYHYPGGGPGFQAAGDFTGWHTFATDWEPGSIKWYYDGQLYFTQTAGVVANQMYLLLQYQGPISNATPVATPGSLLATNGPMLVDYARVWQKGASSGSGGSSGTGSGGGTGGTGSGGGSGNVIQANGNDAHGTTCAVAWPNPTDAGNMLMSVVTCAPTTTITPPSGKGWVALGTRKSASVGGGSWQVYVKASAASVSGTETWGFSTSDFVTVTVVELSGINSTATIDVVGEGGLGSSGTAQEINTPAVTPVNAVAAFLSIQYSAGTRATALTGGSWKYIFGTGVNGDATSVLAWQDGVTAGETIASTSVTWTPGTTCNNPDAYVFTIVELPATGGGGSPSIAPFLQENTANSEGGNGPFSVELLGVTNGNKLVLYAVVDPAPSAGTPTLAVSDDVGGVWTFLKGQTINFWGTQPTRMEIWESNGNPGGDVSIKVDSTIVADSGGVSLWAGELPGSSYDASSGNASATGTSTAPAVTITPAVGDLVFTSVLELYAQNAQPGVPWTYDEGAEGYGRVWASLAWQVVAATTAVTATWGQATSGLWGALAVRFPAISQTSGGGGSGGEPTSPNPSGPVWDDGGLWDPPGEYRFSRVRPESRGRFHQIQFRTLPGGVPFLINVAEFAIRGGKEH